MGRAPCCDSDANVKKGPWTTEEDEKLREYIEENGAGNWRSLPKLAGLSRCGKSCRLRWANYLRPDIKRGRFSDEEEQMIIHFHSLLGNKWSAIASRLPGRTDNEIKNYWNTHLRKKLLKMGIDPVTHGPRTDLNLLASIPNLLAVAASLGNPTANPSIISALQFSQLQLLQSLIHVTQANSSPPNMDAMPLLSPSLRNSTLGLQNQNLNGEEVVAPTNYNYGGSASASYVTTTTTTTTATAANSTPSLVSASPENSFIDQVQEPAVKHSSNISIRSPTTKPFDAWDGLNLDDLDTDLGWKDILNQISWSDAL